MTQENQLLRMVFPPEMWDFEIPEQDKCSKCKGDGWICPKKTNAEKPNWRDGECPDCNGSGQKDGVSGMRYVFNQVNMTRCVVAGRIYLSHAIMGTKMKEEELPNAGMLEAILQSLGGSMDKVEVGTMESEDIIGKTMWINSVFNFFQMGLALEKKGLNPKVSISW